MRKIHIRHFANPKFFRKSGEIRRVGWPEKLIRIVMKREGLKTRDEFYLYHNSGYLGDMPELVVKYGIVPPKTALKEMKKFYFGPFSEWEQARNPGKKEYWEKTLPVEFTKLLRSV